ncbi:MAG: pilus (MSHA type) biogenesis protein MshL [Gammaproteobacteria bacterium]|nr:pilus (MSHA type) biogenesis protein MshL [Gammaproteobacteria bacterium]
MGKKGFITFIHCSLLLLFVCLMSCSTQKAEHGTAYDAIHQTIQTDLARDRALELKRRHVPQAVSDALLPSWPPTHIAKSERHFDIAADGMPAKTFFMGLVAGTSTNMIVNPDVNGNITLNLKNVTIQDALQAVHDMYGYTYKKTSFGYEILPRKLQIALFNVNYLDVQRTGKSFTSLSTDQVSQQVASTSSGSTAFGLGGTSSTSTTTEPSGSTVKTVSESNFWKELKSTLLDMIGTTGGKSVLVNAQAGVVTVRAYPDEIKEVKHFLDRIQSHMSRQVVLEAKILEVTLNDDYQAGINWNMFGKGDPLTNDGGVSQKGTNDFPDTNMKDFASIFTMNLGKGAFNALIKMLQTQGNVQILSSPRLSTVNNQKAVIKVGSDEFFVTGVSTQNTITSSTTTVPTQDVTLTPFFSGITFDVTPEISGDSMITLHIHPAISDVTQKDKEITLGQTSNNTNNNLILPLAFSTIRESDNVVRARSGQVIVIGGLMQNHMIEEIAGVPAVSKLPFVGTFFRRTYQKAVKSELVILLRPVIVSNQVYMTDLERTSNRFHAVKRPFHTGGLAEVFGNQAEEDP